MSHPSSAPALQLLLSVLIALGLGACGSSDAEVSDTPAPRPVEWVPVQAWSGRDAPVYVGRLRDGQLSQLAFEVTGTVSDMRVDIGSEVSKGDLLARLNPRLYDLDVRRAESDIRAAEADLADAEADYERKAALRGTGAIAGSVVDAALARRDSARSTLDGLNAQLGRASKSRRDAELRAPEAGRVVRRLVEPGATVAAGQAVLEVTSEDAPLEAVVEVSERDVGRVEVGDTLRVDVSALRTGFDATVKEVGATASDALGFPVVLSMPDEESLRAGMGVTLELRTDARRVDTDTAGLRLVPLPAVLTDENGGRYVFVISDKLTAEPVSVDVREVTDSGYVLSDGPPLGAKVIARGAVQARAGEPLDPLDPNTRRYPE